MNDGEVRGADEALFLRELARVVVDSGKAQRQIVRESGIPRTTLSDIVRGKRVRVPRPELLHALLKACELNENEIKRWEARRIRVLRALHDGEPADDEAERLNTRLEHALTELDKLRAEEHELRSQIDLLHAERSVLAKALDEERSRHDRSQERITELSTLFTAAQERSAALQTLLDSVIEQSRKADIEAANLRAALSQAESELLYERYRSIQQRTAAPVRLHTEVRQQDGGATGGPSVADVRTGLALQVGRTEETQGRIADALVAMREIAADLARILDGSAAEVLSAVDSALEQSCAELSSALGAAAEFTERARSVLTVGGRITVVTEVVQQCQELIRGSLLSLEEGRKDLEALMYADNNYADLLEVMSVLTQRLDTYQELSAHIIRLIEEYRSAI